MSDSSAEVLLTPEDLSCKPFLKWAGGKGQLIDELVKRVPQRFGRYWEPFLGGGALYFSLRPEVATINDLNQDLISCYKVVRDKLDELVDELKTYPHSSEFYYALRSLDRSEEFNTLSDVKRAARLMYLNKTCFNGLFRVNSKGQFNVPFGRYSNPKIFKLENLKNCSRQLKRTILLSDRFDAVVEDAQEGDFVYFDPPYVPLTTTADFTAYLADGFGEADQELLAVVCLKLNQKGVKWMVSNSNTPVIRELYRGFAIDSVSAIRAINSKAYDRGPVTELLIRNY